MSNQNLCRAVVTGCCEGNDILLVGKGPALEYLITELGCECDEIGFGTDARTTAKLGLFVVTANAIFTPTRGADNIDEGDNIDFENVEERRLTPIELTLISEGKYDELRALWTDIAELHEDER